MKKIVIALCVVGALVGVAYHQGYLTQAYQDLSGASNTAQQAPATAVDAIRVPEKDIIPTASFVAKIESRDKVALRARITGFLQERLFQEGDSVKKDQPLFVIEKVNFEAALREAEANLTKAEAAAANAESQYKRTTTLFKTKDVSESRLDEARAANDTAKATVAQMKALVDLARKDLEYTEIKAPMDGKIGESVFSVGELIGPNSGVLAEVVSVNPIDAVFSVSENQLLMLQKQFGTETDTKVAFLTSDGSVYPEAGSINFVDVTLDEAMNTLKMKAAFPNPNGRLISGQYGRVVLTAKDPVKQLVIPMRAVQRDLTNTFVYLVNDESKIERRPVVLGQELDNFEVVIESGLKAGDIVVTEGFQKIAPQMTVNPTIQ